MKNRIGSIIIGLALVALGVIFAGNVLGLWQISVFFKGWWTLFIIIPCLVSMFTDGPGIANVIGALVGVALLLARQDVITFELVLKLIFPVVLIAVGLFIVFGTHIRGKLKQVRQANPGDGKNYSAVFGSQKAFYPAEPFEGAECSAVFGGVELDLRAAIIEKDVVIDVSAVFGGITIYLPTTVKVVTHNTPIFGGMSCKRLMMGELPENAPTVYVSGVCAFGGVEIK